MAVETRLATTPGAATVGLAIGTPHSERLAALLSQQARVPVRILTEQATSQDSQWVLVDAAHLPWAQARWPQPRIVVVAMAAQPAWAGYTVLTGPLPDPVLTWARQIAPAPAPPPDPLLWQSAPAPEPEPPMTVRPAWSPAADTAPPAAARVDKGRTLAVYSSGGGVGKTTTAVYLATLAAQARQAVGLVELDEDRRGILTYWHQALRQGGLDSIPPHVWLDPPSLAESLARLAVPVSARLQVLPMAGTVTGLQYPLDHADQAMQALLDWARAQYRWTVFDLSARVRDTTTLTVLKTVDQIVWVMEPTEIMLDSSRGYLDLLEQLGPEGHQIIQKIGLVVNKLEKRRTARLDPASMADALGLPLLGVIASDPVKYLSGINQHKIDPTPEWRHLADVLRLGEEMPGASPSGPARPRRKAWWSRRDRD